MSKSEPHVLLEERYLDQPYQLAGRRIDPVAGVLSWQGKREHLRRKELEVLALLASAAGKQVSRENFIAVIWQGNDMVGDRGLSSTIGFLRRSLHDEDPDQPLIRTIPRRGYQLAAAVLDIPRLASDRASELVPSGLIPAAPDWRLVKQLGESSTSVTWLAEPSEYGERDQGLRVFRFCQSEAHLRLLQREVTFLRYLHEALAQHHQFALIRDWQLDEPPYFLARDYTRFGSLRQWDGLTKLCLADRLVMMQSLCDAVSAMHDLGVVHRQLNADTTLVDESQAGVQLKISAFDLATLSDRSALASHKITAAGLTLGDGEAGAELSASGDIAALGTLLLQIALADLSAQASLANIENTALQALLGRCAGPSATRPSATELSLALGKIAVGGSEADQAASPSDRLKKTATAEFRGSGSDHSNPKLAGLPGQIGNYRLLDRLGEGGMGSVYLAEQRDPYRKVALKIIRSGLDGKQVLSRFEAELQALAMMNHPNVAMALDSGLAPDGRPFFAMEYVAGVDITSYCDSRCLDIRARIQLFLQVCDGVWHAHQKGVLHRDLKPSNLMVSQTQETLGTVKVIDFGLAKSLHGKLAAQTLHTSFGAFVGTPVYCSPEHISGAALGVDTRSDIYALGVVLYELLAGNTPIPSASLEQLEPEKVRDLICRSSLPSMRQQLLSASAERRAVLAEQRSSKMEELPTTLDGDLSWVVGKCLERDPNDRYGSVLELRKELERWLEFRPVEARPTTRWYRFRKLVRRHRGMSIAVATGLALITISTAAAFVGYFEAKRALANEKIANAEAKDALEFQVKQFESLDVGAIGVGMRQSVIEGLKSHTQSLNLDATSESLQTKMTDAVASMNFTDLVVEQLEKHYFDPTIAVINERYLQNPTLQEALWSSTAENLEHLGRFKAALALRNKILTQRQQRLGLSDLQTLDAQMQMGQVLLSMEEAEKAKPLLEQAIQKVLQIAGAHNEQSIRALHALAILETDSEKSLALFREALAAGQIKLGENSLVTLRVQVSLGAAMKNRGDLAEAATLLESAYERARATFGEANYETSIAVVALAGLRMSQGKSEEAMRMLRDSLAHVREQYGSSNTAALLLANNLATSLYRLERYPQALQVVRELESVHVARGLEKTAAYLNVRGMLGTTLLALGKLQEAEPYVRSANYPQRLGELHFAQGRFEEARAAFQKAIDQSLQLQDFASPRLSNARAGLGHIALVNGELAGARKMLEQALADSRKVLTHQAAQTLKVQALYALSLPTSGPEPTALTMLREVVKQQQSTPGVLAKERLVALTALTRLLLEQSEAKEALTHAAIAVELGDKLFPDGHYLLAAALTQQGRAMKVLGQSGGAKKAFARAQRMIDDTEGLDPAYRKDLMHVVQQVEPLGLQP